MMSPYNNTMVSLPGYSPKQSWINPGLGRMNISPCTVNYAKALADPWNPQTTQDVCLPDTNAVSSFKFHTRSRGTMTVNSSGFGYVAVSPVALANSALQSVSFSNLGTGASVSTVPVTTNTAWNTSINSNSPFGNTNTSLLPLMRPVVVGVRIRYSGTELNRGGSIAFYKSKSLNNSESASGQSFATILLANTCNVASVDRKWHGVTWTPYDDMDANYVNVGTGYDIIGNGYNKELCLLVQSQAGNTFDFDISGFFEAIPYTNVTSDTTSAPPSVSKSEVDSDGYSFVKGVYASVADNVSGPGLWNLFQTAAKAYYVDEIPLASAFRTGLRDML
jgi:hypothetical protein